VPGPCRSCGRETPHHRPRTEVGLSGRSNIVVELLLGLLDLALGNHWRCARCGTKKRWWE
jgi:hypothetical protein